MHVDTWYITFGFGHVHPFTKESLANCYVVLTGSEVDVRTKMIERFGQRWAFVYDSADAAGVERYNLREIEWIDTIYKDQ